MQTKRTKKNRNRERMGEAEIDITLLAEFESSERESCECECAFDFQNLNATETIEYKSRVWCPKNEEPKSWIDVNKKKDQKSKKRENERGRNWGHLTLQKERVVRGGASSVGMKREEEEEEGRERERERERDKDGMGRRRGR